MVKTLWTALLLSAIAVFSAPVLADPPVSYPPDLDLTATVWQVITNLNVNNIVPIANDTAGSLYFDFPVEPDQTCQPGLCDTINYLFTTHVPKSISGNVVITLRVGETTGTFLHTRSPDCGDPSVRALIWSHNQSNQDGWRWWSNPISYTLAPGTVTLVIPIDPNFWSGLNGQWANDDLTHWQRAIGDVSSLGVTFGNVTCTFGHGVYMIGETARFTLENYEVVPNCPAVTPCNGTSCVTSNETGDTNSNLDGCVNAGGQFMKCNSPQKVHVVSTNCQQGPCCTATPFPCVCFPCPGGSHLECR